MWNGMNIHMDEWKKMPRPSFGIAPAENRSMYVFKLSVLYMKHCVSLKLTWRCEALVANESATQDPCNQYMSLNRITHAIGALQDQITFWKKKARVHAMFIRVLHHFQAQEHFVTEINKSYINSFIFQCTSSCYNQFALTLTNMLGSSKIRFTHQT